MAIEIERKFLVKGDFRKDVVDVIKISQGYICAQPDKTVRVRINDNKGFLTIKGPTDTDGMSRYEFEHEISLDEAHELMKLCLPGSIEKERFYAEYADKRWEVDVFYGNNEGLIVAEIELSSPNEQLSLPDWVGEEVTGQKRYYNAMLTKEPYNKWK